jgi:ketosteroid isomerase-like protein
MDLLQLARKWLACFDTHDVETLVSLYAEDARHTSPKLRVSRPETNGEIVGKAALRDWWADAFRRLPQLRYVERTLTSDGERVWMEYDRKVPGEADMRVAEVLVVRDGLIIESRVYHG